MSHRFSVRTWFNRPTVQRFLLPWLLCVSGVAQADPAGDTIESCLVELEAGNPWLADPCLCENPVSTDVERFLKRCRDSVVARGGDPTRLDRATYRVIPSCPCMMGCCPGPAVWVQPGGGPVKGLLVDSPPKERKAEPSLVLSNIRVVDANGDHGIRDVVITGGRIAGMDPGDSPPNAKVIDGSGKTLVPGLVDTHVHISMAPGAAWREESAKARTERRSHHLRAYLAWGVTTILDPAILPEDAREIRDLSRKGPSPEVLFLGPTISPVGGYPANVLSGFPAVERPDQIPPLLDTFSDLEALGVKITMEDGFLRPVWPLHSKVMRDALIAETDQRGLRRYIHASDPKMTRLALEMGPHALVHAPQTGSRRLARAVAEAGPFVAPTLAIIGTATLPWNLERLEDERVRLTVPTDELETARSPEVLKAFQSDVLEIVAPRMPEVLRNLMVGGMVGEGSIDRRLAKAVRTSARLHEAGVPLILGSDSGNWPVIPYMFHGPTTHVELAMLSRAGLSPLEVLTAATRTPARMLGLEDEIGLVEPGMRADLVVLPGNPLEEPKFLSEPEWVIRNGEIRSPESWMGP